MSGYQMVLVPYDFSTHANAALYTAADLGKRLGADLHLLHIVAPPTYVYGYGAFAGEPAPLTLDLEKLLAEASRSLENVAAGIQDYPGTIEAHTVEGTNTANQICEFAENHGADVIVMGTHGRTGLAHVFLGSVAERTLRRAPCPVLTLRAPADDS